MAAQMMTDDPTKPPAPKPDNENAEAAADPNAAVKAQVEEELSELPDADAPYDPACLADVKNAAEMAFKALLGDQASQIPPITLPEGDVTHLPPELMLPIVVLCNVMLAPISAAKKYKVDAASLKDDKALRMLSAKLEALSKDKAVLKAIESEKAPAVEPVESKPKMPPVRGKMPEGAGKFAAV
jgi:hypothetical protein